METNLKKEVSVMDQIVMPYVTELNKNLKNINITDMPHERRWQDWIKWLQSASNKSMNDVKSALSQSNRIAFDSLKSIADNKKQQDMILTT